MTIVARWITFLVLAFPCVKGPAQTIITERVSVATGGAESDGGPPFLFSSLTSITSDGRFVAFRSFASDLVPGDTNGAADVFIHDRQTRTTERVSVATGGAEGEGTSGDPSISSDGRFVAFRSSATNLVTGDTNEKQDVFVHDRQTGSTERVSVATDGAESEGFSDNPSISSDGRYVAFASGATNLVPGDTNGRCDIFVHDRQTGTTERVSVGPGGTQGDRDSDFPSISSNGQFVAFESRATNLVPGDTNNAEDVLVHDRQTGTTERISVATGGTEGDGDSGGTDNGPPSISADGRFVAFSSEAANLVPGDMNGTSDVFVHDRQTGTTERVSVATDGAESENGAGSPSISTDGRLVAFGSSATNLVPGDTNGRSDIFVRDRQSGTTVRVSVATGSTQSNGHSGPHSLSGDGRSVVFESEATNLVPGDTNENRDVFVSERVFVPSTFQPAFELSSLNGDNGFVINGIDENDNSGISVSSAGDFNADGLDDVIIGAEIADSAGTELAGESYVVFGRREFPGTIDLSALDGSNGVLLPGIDAYDLLGRSVSDAGDINDDGIADVIVGARQADPAGIETAGESYVVFGTSADITASIGLASLNGSNGFAINGLEEYDNSGFSVSDAGDVNGDAIDDIVIGAPSGGANGAGEIYIVFGSGAPFAASIDLTSLDGSNGFLVSGITLNDSVGSSVSGAGDVNGDGISDLIIGARNAGPGGESFSGQSYVLFGHDQGFPAAIGLNDLNGINGFALNGVDPFDRAGESVSAAGDFNGDGFDDVLIGASFADLDTQDEGASYIIFGCDQPFQETLDLSSLDGTNGIAINGILGGDRFGISVSRAGDFNGDGLDDVIIGAAGADPGARINAGQSYILFGFDDASVSQINLADLADSRGIVINGIRESDFSGRAVSGAGDVNGDGLADVIISATAADPDGRIDAGVSYVVFGIDRIFFNSFEASNPQE